MCNSDGKTLTRSDQVSDLRRMRIRMKPTFSLAHHIQLHGDYPNQIFMSTNFGGIWLGMTLKFLLDYDIRYKRSKPHLLIQVLFQLTKEGTFGRDSLRQIPAVISSQRSFPNLGFYFGIRW